MAALAMSGFLFDSIVCDPPYDLLSTVKRFGSPTAAPAKPGTDGAFARASKGFMGQMWDGTGIAFDADTWRRAFDVLKPGGHLVAFGGSRTFHRMACAIEDAGLEIRDTLMWIYGTGFPKSHDVSKGIDATLTRGSARTEDMRRMAMGDEYEASGRGRANYDHGGGSVMNGATDWTPDSLEAAMWTGWGTALKPAFEPIILARKPLDGTVAGNTLKHGVGGINIDGCRVEGPGVLRSTGSGKRDRDDGYGMQGGVTGGSALGRHPANILHDGSDEVVSMFPVTTSGTGAVKRASGAGYQGNALGKESRPAGTPNVEYGDSGSAARFFYSTKASKVDRAGSDHPTVKPLALMRWLCRLVTPAGGHILDPFAGSGSTLEAAYREGFDAIGCEMMPQYCLDIINRLARLP